MKMTEIINQKCCKNVEVFRNMIQGLVDRHDYESATFWADKLVSISNGSQQDVYTLAKCMFLSGQFHRAANVLIFYQYERTNLHFRSLTARCLYKAREYQKALEVLDLENKSVHPGQKVRASVWEPADSQKSIMGQVHLIRGKIHEALMNRILAAHNYKEALASDIYCFEAFELLTQNQMLSRAEEMTLLQSLPFSKSCTNGDVEFVRFLYTSKVKKYPTAEPTAVVIFPSLKKNLDILTGEAERHFYNCDFQTSFKMSSQVITEDPFHMGCLPVYVACLVEMSKITELFKVAHRLVEVMSDSALSWYAVGAYYFLIGKQDNARRHLNKSLSLNPVFGPAWLLFGHSFASENEHDQAMAAYFKATQLMKGCHLPMLHVGMECGLSNNPLLAMKFLEEARLLAPRDPFIRHEMGVVKFSEKKYDEAHSFFMETLGLLEKPSYSVSFKKWEPLYNNLGHVLRKMLKYDEALAFHQKALVICPSNASTHSAIGLIHAITGKTESAIESFHKALSIRRDDACSNTMLRYCVEKLVEDSHEDDENVVVMSDEEEEKIYDRPMRTRSGKLKSADVTPRGSTDSIEALPEPKRTRTPRKKDHDKDMEAPGQLSFFKFSLSSMQDSPEREKRHAPNSTPSSTPTATSTPTDNDGRRRTRRELRSTVSTPAPPESTTRTLVANSSSDDTDS
ncbi:cell division cycle protein 16 homolog [Folsomia candida]|nr:cell division cycle protein 16 homolog [Folsomia candida]